MPIHRFPPKLHPPLPSCPILTPSQPLPSLPFPYQSLLPHPSQAYPFPLLPPQPITCMVKNFQSLWKHMAKLVYSLDTQKILFNILQSTFKLNAVLAICIDCLCYSIRRERSRCLSRMSGKLYKNTWKSTCSKLNWNIINWALCFIEIDCASQPFYFITEQYYCCIVFICLSVSC